MKTLPLLLAALIAGPLLHAEPLQEPPASQFDITELIGDQLIDANGSPVDLASLRGKFVGIYFTARWCIPGRNFTAQLLEFRKQTSDQFEVILVSADRDAPTLFAHMQDARMPWPAIPFGSERIPALNKAFQILFVPAFVVIDPAGRLASSNARHEVSTLSPKDALAKWTIPQPDHSASL